MAFLLRRKKKKKKGVNQEKIQKVSLLIQKNDDKILMLTKKEVSLQNRMTAEVEKAKDYARKSNKRMAKHHLLRKKQLETQLITLMAQKTQVETVNLKLQEQLTTLEVFDAQRQGKEMMQEMTKEIGTVDDVVDVMDDLRDQMADVSEMSAALGEEMGDNSMEDDDLLSELEAIEKEVVDEELLGMNEVISPTSAPAEKKVVGAPAKSAEELDLDNELGALMADLN